MQNDSCYETAAFFFSSHIIVKLRTTSFVIVSSVLRYVAFLGECGRAIASHFRREKKSLSALWRKKRVRPFPRVWRVARVARSPKVCLSLAQIFSRRFEREIRAVRPVASGRLQSFECIRCSMEEQKLVAPLNYTKCPSKKRREIERACGYPI